VGNEPGTVVEADPARRPVPLAQPSVRVDEDAGHILSEVADHVVVQVWLELREISTAPVVVGLESADDSRIKIASDRFFGAVCPNGRHPVTRWSARPDDT
jgi:hypothetical protein